MKLVERHDQKLNCSPKSSRAMFFLAADASETSRNSKRCLTTPLVVIASRGMKLKRIFLLTLALAVFGLSGCVETLDNRHRATWNPIAKDRVEGRYDRSPAEIWTAAKDVLKHQGTLVGEDTLKNVLEASVDERRIWVKVEEFDTRTTRVLVQAQTKSLLPDMEMAAFIDKQIAIRLATGNLTPTAPVKR